MVILKACPKQKRLTSGMHNEFQFDLRVGCLSPEPELPFGRVEIKIAPWGGHTLPNSLGRVCPPQGVH